MSNFGGLYVKYMDSSVSRKYPMTDGVCAVLSSYELSISAGYEILVMRCWGLISEDTAREVVKFLKECGVSRFVFCLEDACPTVMLAHLLRNRCKVERDISLHSTKCSTGVMPRGLVVKLY